MMKNCGEVVQQSVAEKDILPEMVKIVKKKVNRYSIRCGHSMHLIMERYYSIYADRHGCER